MNGTPYSFCIPYNADLRSNDTGNFITGKLEEALKYLIRYTKEEYRMLFVGMAAGPFMLIMKANNPESFLSYARSNPSHKINIHWNKTDSNGRRWIIMPKEYRNKGYELSFTLPEKLSEIIFKSNDPRETALDIKRDIFSDITIYNFNNQTDELFRLSYKNDYIIE